MEPLLPRAGLISRRRFLMGAFAGGVVAAVPVHSSRDTTSSIELVERQIPIRDLPSDFNNYRIGFLTDLHVGVNVPFHWADEALTKITNARADLLLLGGDYIAMNDSAVSRLLQQHRNERLRTSRSHEFPSIVFDGVARLFQGAKVPDGVFGVYGNHDRWVQPAICEDCFERAGIPLLVNESHRIRRGGSELLLYGTDDFWNGAPSLKNLPPRDGKSTVRIFLSHNPDFVSESLRLADADFDLSLSGHTHGGQIKAPGVGAIFYNVDDLRLAEGLFTWPNGTQSYTSRGIGVVEIPYRVNCPPEATVLELVKA